MLNRTWLPALSTLGAALLLSSCTAVDADVDPRADESASSASETAEPVTDIGDEAPSAPDALPAGPPEDDSEHPGGQQIIIGPEGVDFFYISAEEDDGSEVFHLHCQDEEALTAKAAHNGDAEPAGWPQDWDGTGAMPDPLCHPDYLQIDEWENLEAHTACWEGIETSTLVRDGESQEEVDKDLWQQSKARADWAPNPPGGNCAEQWAENDGG